MPEQQNPFDPTSADDGRGDGPSRFRPFMIAVLVLGVLAAFQWPMVKGLYYRMTGAGPKDNIPWRTDFNAALLESRQTGKPVLLDFYADWCPPCQTMKHDVWPDAHLGQVVSASYIPMAVNVDGHGMREIAARYGVNSIPRIIIVDADGRVLKTGSFMSLEELLRFLR